MAIGALTFGVSSVTIKDTTAVGLRTYLYNRGAESAEVPLRAYAAEGLSADQARALSRSAAANARLAERLSRCGPAGGHKCKAGVRS